MMAEASETNIHEIEGMTFEVSTKLRGGLFGETSVLCIRGDAQNFLQLPEEFRFALGECSVVQLEAVDEGSVVRTESSLFYLRRTLEAYFREKKVAAHRKALASLTKQCEAVEQRDFSVVLLRELLKKIAQAIDELFWKQGELMDIPSALEVAKQELERVQKMPTEVLVRDIFEGRVQHEDHLHNLKVLASLEQLEIRSGGRLEAVSREWLASYYLLALEGVMGVGEAKKVPLRVSLDDFVSRESREDPSIVELMAPETLELEGRRGVKSYPIEYGYGEVDGDRVPIGQLKVPLSVYECQSSHPCLPHGICLIVSLTVANRIVVTGVADERLEEHIKSYRRNR